MPHRATVVGLGRIGLPFAAYLASKGAEVRGVENSPQRLEMIRARQWSSQEASVGPLLQRHGSRIELCDLAGAVSASELTFLVVPTVSRPDGSLSEETLRAVASDIARARAGDPAPHTVAVVSTVSPGTMRRLAAEMAGSRLRLCYAPQFVALGNILAGLEQPPFLLVGSDDAAAGGHLCRFYGDIGYPEPLIARTDLLNAEIAKLTLNAFLSAKIAFANTLAAICDAAPGADVDQVMGIVGRDPRVGPALLRGGSPFGGPCLPRDCEAVIQFAESAGVEAGFVRAVQDANEFWHERLLQDVLRRAPYPGCSIAVVGLAYKPGTDYLETGFGLRLAQDLAARGYAVHAFDPGFDGRRLAQVAIHRDLADAVRRAEVCVLTWPDEELARQAVETAGDTRVIDVWRLLRGYQGGGSVFGAGVGPEQEPGELALDGEKHD